MKGKIVGHHIVLDIPVKERHYWSPQLNFRVEPFEDNERFSLVAGLVGPRPNVWTMFVFIYFIVGVLGFFISSYGLVEWMLGRWSNYLWGLPVTVLLLLTAYLTSKHGEQLAAEQTAQLKDFVRRAILFDVDHSTAA